ncbi:MAG: AAA family ATPase [Asgard group archaeon]|nr:AAA family ATPase [Asgard group archaeon]
MSNILITGYPRSGKTTLIMKFLEFTTKSCSGFYTEEIKNSNGFRIGFKIIGISSKQEEIRAHVNENGNYKVGKYIVNIDNFEKIALYEMEKKSDLIIVDEIGKMELFSECFKKQLLKCLDQGNVLATITMKGGGKFVWDIKNRKDVKILEITKNNRNQILKDLKSLLE